MLFQVHAHVVAYGYFPAFDEQQRNAIFFVDDSTAKRFSVQPFRVECRQYAVASFV